MLVRVVLPLVVFAVAGLLYAMGLKLVAAPLLLLVVWPFWIGMIVGIGLTLQANFVFGALIASLLTGVLLAISDPFTINPETIGLVLFAPWVPLAVIQLVASPFQLRMRRWHARNPAR